MKNLGMRLLRDEAGFIVSTELVLVSTIVVIALTILHYVSCWGPLSWILRCLRLLLRKCRFQHFIKVFFKILNDCSEQINLVNDRNKLFGFSPKKQENLASEGQMPVAEEAL